MSAVGGDHIYIYLFTCMQTFDLLFWDLTEDSMGLYLDLIEWYGMIMGISRGYNGNQSIEHHRTNYTGDFHLI